MELCETERFAQCNKNAVLTAALLHDVCKAGKYIAKPEGGYRYRDTRMLGHGEESIILIQHWMYLTEKETLAIRWHMGFSGPEDARTVGQAFQKYPLAFALATADMEASYFLENEENP